MDLMNIVPPKKPQWILPLWGAGGVMFPQEQNFLLVFFTCKMKKVFDKVYPSALETIPCKSAHLQDIIYFRDERMIFLFFGKTEESLFI